MANIKITDLTAYTDAASTAVLPIVDVGADVTKKITIGNVVKAVPLGTAALPGLAFDGDPNSGVYSPGGDQVAISTNGTGRLFIDASGNVGVGVSPSAKFQVNGVAQFGATGQDGTIQLLRSSDGGAVASLGFISGTTEVKLNNALSGPTTFYTNNTERLRITSTGTLMHLGAGNSTTPAVQFNGSAPVNSLVMDSSGKVGLGTSSPAYQLDLGGGTTVSSRIQLQRGSDDTNQHMRLGWSGIDMVRANVALASSQTSFSLRQVGSDGTRNCLHVDSSGRVGIGSTSPSYALDVKTSAETAVRIDSGSANNAVLRFAQAGVNKAFIQYPNGGGLTFGPAGSEKARIDSDGRLLVGTSSASTGTTAQYSKLQILGNLSSSASGAQLNLGRNETSANVGDGELLGRIHFTDNQAGEYATIEAEADGTPAVGDYPGRLVFSTTADSASSPTERMRITSKGKIGIGVSATGANGVYTTGYFTVNSDSTTSSGDVGAEFYSGYTAARHHVSFSNPNGVVGSISTNASATAYNTSSDYRLKENVIPLTGAADRLNQLQVHRFNFIADPSKTVDGFIAHEAQAVVPECVTGTKDEVDADGNPVYQGIDQSKLVPLLTAALQEALAEIESLKARVTALEP